jgi:uncharacterized protein (TIGR02246 family)
MKDEVQLATAALVAALENGDAAAASSVYADDAKLLTPGADLLEGRDSIEAHWRAGIALGLSTVRFEARRLRDVGGTAVEIGRYDLSVASALVEHGTYVVLHRRIEDGSWQRALDVFDPDGPSSARQP